jgi:hypothetical protein
MGHSFSVGKRNLDLISLPLPGWQPGRADNDAVIPAVESCRRTVLLAGARVDVEATEETRGADVKDTIQTPRT